MWAGRGQSPKPLHRSCRRSPHHLQQGHSANTTFRPESRSVTQLMCKPPHDARSPLQAGNPLTDPSGVRTPRASSWHRAKDPEQMQGPWRWAGNGRTPRLLHRSCRRSPNHLQQEHFARTTFGLSPVWSHSSCASRLTTPRARCKPGSIPTI